MIERPLAEYANGDPKEPEEFARYQAFKDEASWLRDNPGK